MLCDLETMIEFRNETKNVLWFKNELKETYMKCLGRTNKNFYFLQNQNTYDILPEYINPT